MIKLFILAADDKRPAQPTDFTVILYTDWVHFRSIRLGLQARPPGTGDSNYGRILEPKQMEPAVDLSQRVIKVPAVRLKASIFSQALC